MIIVTIVCYRCHKWTSKRATGRYLIPLLNIIIIRFLPQLPRLQTTNMGQEYVILIILKPLPPKVNPLLLDVLVDITR